MTRLRHSPRWLFQTAEPSISSQNEIGLRELVVCSLEAWDEIWRRNQFFVDALLRRNQELRVLFVEPPTDVLFDLWKRRAPRLPRLRKPLDDERFWTFRPLKPFPRRLGEWVDGALRFQLLLAIRAIGFSRPTLWINDVTYGPLIRHSGWPALYDVTDDWLLAPNSSRELQRLRRLDKLSLEQADEVVVCSPALAQSRGVTRAVTLVPNAVDVEHFKHPQMRPADLPASPIAVYVGSLHDSRIDVHLVSDVAQHLPHLTLVFVGPNSLSSESRRALARFPNIVFLGQKPYDDVPAYLQHADVVIVPHRISPFTDSLDPIKVYECLAISRPTVATPVAGFRDQRHRLHIAEPTVFASRVADVLSQSESKAPTAEPPRWSARAVEFERALVRAATKGRQEEAADYRGCP